MQHQILSGVLGMMEKVAVSKLMANHTQIRKGRRPYRVSTLLKKEKVPDVPELLKEESKEAGAREELLDDALRIAKRKVKRKSFKMGLSEAGDDLGITTPEKRAAKDYGPGGKWIHDRAHGILKDNPETPKAVAYAVATQQAHKVGKSPKDFRTPEGVHEAKMKYDAPKSEYQKTAGIEEQKRLALLAREAMKGGTSFKDVFKKIQSGGKKALAKLAPKETALQAFESAGKVVTGSARLAGFFDELDKIAVLAQTVIKKSPGQLRNMMAHELQSSAGKPTARFFGLGSAQATAESDLSKLMAKRKAMFGSAARN